jgi:hypothetical protein
MAEIEVLGPDDKVVGYMSVPEGASEEEFQTKLQEAAERFGGIKAAPDTGITQLLRQEGPQTGGAILGSIRGAQIGGLAGGAPGAMAGGVGGAFVGGGGAELARQGIEAAFGTEQAPESLSQAFDRAGRAGLQQAVGEAVGLGVLWGGGKMLKPFVRQVTPEAARAAEFLDPLVEKAERFPGFFRKGVVRPATITPAQATDNRFLDILDNVTSSAIFGGRMSQQKAMQRKVLEQWRQEFVESLGKNLSPSDIGQAYVDAVTKRWSPWQEFLKTGWNALEKKAGEVTRKRTVSEVVDTGLLSSTGKPIRRKVSRVVEEKGVRVDITKVREDLADPIRRAKLPGGDEIGQGMLRALEELPKNPTFSDVKAFRSKVLRVQRAAAKAGEDPGAFKLLNKHLTEAMGDALKKQAPELYTEWRALSTMEKTSHERFDNEVIKSLRKMVDVKGEPQRVVQRLFTKENVTQIRIARESIDDETFGVMQRWFIENAYKKSGGSGEKLLEDMTKGPENTGREVYREVLGPKLFKEWEEFANTLNVTQQKQSEGIGGMMVQLAQSGAVVRTAHAAATGTAFTIGGATPAATILVGPSVLARMMTNEKSARLLREGMRMPRVGKTSKPEFISQLLAAIATAEDEVARERAAESPIAVRTTGAF